MNDLRYMQRIQMLQLILFDFLQKVQCITDHIKRLGETGECSQRWTQQITTKCLHAERVRDISSVWNERGRREITTVAFRQNILVNTPNKVNVAVQSIQLFAYACVQCVWKGHSSVCVCVYVLIGIITTTAVFIFLTPFSLLSLSPCLSMAKRSLSKYTFPAVLHGYVCVLLSPHPSHLAQRDGEDLSNILLHLF